MKRSKCEFRKPVIRALLCFGFAAGFDTDRILRESAQEFVDYLLFVDEAQLPAPIQSTAARQSSAFARVFTARGPFDRQGRSLRELDLQHRMLRYPCSYMIYSDAFDA